MTASPLRERKRLRDDFSSSSLNFSSTWRDFRRYKEIMEAKKERTAFAVFDELKSRGMDELKIFNELSNRFGRNVAGKVMRAKLGRR